MKVKMEIIYESLTKVLMGLSTGFGVAGLAVGEVLMGSVLLGIGIIGTITTIGFTVLENINCEEKEND